MQGGHVAATYALTAERPPPACLMLSSWLGKLRYEVRPALVMLCPHRLASHIL